jgi:methanethiol S-methyltransferase
MLLQNTLWIVISFVAFAVVHSLTAGVGLPERLKQIIGSRSVDGWYRVAYNVFSVVTFMPVVYLMVSLPDSRIYVLGGLAAFALRFVQLAGAAGLLWALWSIDLFRFAGLRQAWAYLQGSALPLPYETLQQSGLYSLVRHPLYLFSLIILWATPNLSFNGLLFNICSTLYFGVGALIEEHRLEHVYGDAYRAYRRDVGWIIPRPPR